MSPRRASDLIAAEFLMSRRDVDPAAAAVDNEIAADFLDWVRDDQDRRLTPGGVAAFLARLRTESRAVSPTDAGRAPAALAALVRFLARRGDITARAGAAIDRALRAAPTSPPARASRARKSATKKRSRTGAKGRAARKGPRRRAPAKRP